MLTMKFNLVRQLSEDMIGQTQDSNEIPVRVDPFDDGKAFFILAESLLASNDPRLPVC